jgi:hypothetical protein
MECEVEPAVELWLVSGVCHAEVSSGVDIDMREQKGIWEMMASERDEEKATSISSHEQTNT